MAPNDQSLLVVSDSSESVRRRLPMNLDGIFCVCGGKVFRAGVAEAGKSCDYCGSLILLQCVSCSSWVCVGCVEARTITERMEHGVATLYGENRRTPS